MGDGGSILEYADGNWREVVTPYTRNLYGIDGTDSKIWAVGEKGTVLLFEGTEWTTVTSGVQENLWSVWVSGTGVPFIVGSGGTALTINEDTVRPLNTGLSMNLYSVWGSAENNVWAVGNRGTILRYKGDN